MRYNIKSMYNSSLPLCVTDFLGYLETIKGKSTNTIEAYKTDLIMFFRFLKIYKGISDDNLEFEDISINDIDEKFLVSITLTDLYAFISFAEKYRKNGNYARARKVATLKSFFKYLHSKAKIIDENPATELESPKINQRHPVYLTLNESKKLLASMNIKEKYYERDYCIITLFLNCGLRLSELCSINLSKIKGDTLSIVGKGNKERTVYLNKITLNAIENYLKVRDVSKVSDEDKDALFISSKNRRINKRSVERIVKKHIEVAGLDVEKYTPHKLRHTAATLMYKHGNVDIRSLQEILGHENISTTQIYTHVDDERLREAVSLNPLNDEIL
ncbi:tyrosine recombinase XerC [Clostridium sp. MSJ-4]|uniref:Tyrosine recombinase XerC n=1 Tax=Clostridium simiarum TaxID=2841506 RepID=A0ABS6EWS3_9CLOT|nr:tyrosine recombinase XerC [Clostridium simiarum]MBU5590672.1 tyrosine recombinase XerC [Clostridium simiarum]